MIYDNTLKIVDNLSIFFKENYVFLTLMFDSLNCLCTSISKENVLQTQNSLNIGKRI